MYKLQAYTAAADRIWDTVEESTLLDPEFRYSDISDSRKTQIVLAFLQACTNAEQHEIIGEATSEDPRASLWGCMIEVRRHMEKHLDEYLTREIHDRAISFLDDVREQIHAERGEYVLEDQG